MNRRWIATGLMVMGLVHGGCVQVVRQQAPPEIKVKTPDPFLASGDPELLPTAEAEWLAAPSLDASCYYYKKDKTWYRFYRNRWFQAFRWDGNWFELPENEVPPFLRTQAEIEPEIKKSKSKRDRLEELERQFEEIERREREAEEQKRNQSIEPSGSESPSAPK